MTITAQSDTVIMESDVSTMITCFCCSWAWMTYARTIRLSATITRIGDKMLMRRCRPVMRMQSGSPSWPYHRSLATDSSIRPAGFLSLI